MTPNSVSSIFREALGADFDRLHFMLQRRFGVGLDAGYACVGTGTMFRVRRGPWWTVPFLWLGSFRNILVPDVDTQVPFTIENYPYRDPLGRETITFVRSYEMYGKQRRFDATMVLRHGRIVDYLGTHQHLAADIDATVGDDGSLHIHTGGQRFYAGRIGFRFPMLFSGHGDLHESFDDERGVYRVDLQVRNRVFGFLFGYDGEFTCEFPAATDAPERLKPVRHESRG